MLREGSITPPPGPFLFPRLLPSRPQNTHPPSPASAPPAVAAPAGSCATYHLSGPPSDRPGPLSLPGAHWPLAPGDTAQRAQIRLLTFPSFCLLLTYPAPTPTPRPQRVILDGFKSYANRTVVDQFDPEFNAITGLNGSGKSNILDSICFVLGITNLTQVRPRLSSSGSRALSLPTPLPRPEHDRPRPSSRVPAIPFP